MSPSDEFHTLKAFSPQLCQEVAAALNGKSLLVTGGFGLVGLSALSYVQHLRDEYSSKISLTLTSKTSSALSLAGNFGTEFEFIEADLAKKERLDEISGYDFIMHLAGYAQPGKFMSDPASTLTLNSLATLELRKKSTLGFAFVSSSEVYSGLNHPLISETEIGTTKTSHERAAYIEGKRFGEAASLIDLGSGTPTGSVARLSLAYGPGTRDGDQRVLSELINRGLTKGIVALQDTGDRLRTYCYSDDAIEMLFGVMVKGEGDIFNVGGHSLISIRELGKLVAEKLGVDFEAPEIDKDKDSSPVNVSIDVSKVSGLLNKQEFVSIETGLDKTIEWHRRLLQ